MYIVVVADDWLVGVVLYNSFRTEEHKVARDCQRVQYNYQNAVSLSYHDPY